MELEGDEDRVASDGNLLVDGAPFVEFRLRLPPRRRETAPRSTDVVDNTVLAFAEECRMARSALESGKRVRLEEVEDLVVGSGDGGLGVARNPGRKTREGHQRGLEALDGALDDLAGLLVDLSVAKCDVGRRNRPQHRLVTLAHDGLDLGDNRVLVLVPEGLGVDVLAEVIEKSLDERNIFEVLLGGEQLGVVEAELDAGVVALEGALPVLATDGAEEREEGFFGGCEGAIRECHRLANNGVVGELGEFELPVIPSLKLEAAAESVAGRRSVPVCREQREEDELLETSLPNAVLVVRLLLLLLLQPLLNLLAVL
jgi:hypothetical protein